MKIVIQNGAAHGFTRKQLGSMVHLFPPAWDTHIQSIALYQGDNAEPVFKYFPKERILGVFWPVLSEPRPSLAAAAKELLVAFAVVAARGSLPQRISKSAR